MSRRSVPLLAFVLLLLSPHLLYAYLDPASGSMIVQLILGGAAGLAVILRLVWRRMAALLTPRKGSGGP